MVAVQCKSLIDLTQTESYFSIFKVFSMITWIWNRSQILHSTHSWQSPHLKGLKSKLKQRCTEHANIVSFKFSSVRIKTIRVANFFFLIQTSNKVVAEVHIPTDNSPNTSLGPTTPPLFIHVLYVYTRHRNESVAIIKLCYIFLTFTQDTSLLRLLDNIFSVSKNKWCALHNLKCTNIFHNLAF